MARRRAFWLSIVLGLGAAVVSAQAPQGDLPMRVPAASDDLQNARRHVREAEAEGARASTEIDALEARIVGRREMLRERLRALYRITRAGTLPLAGGLDAMLAHTSRVERLDRIVRADAAALRFLEAQRDALVTSVAQSQRARADAEVKRAALEAKAVATGAYSIGPGTYLPNLPVVPLPGRPTPPQSPYGGVGVAAAANAEPSVAGFAALEGSLGWPLRGPSTARDSVRDNRSGLELLSPAGTPVIAAASGQVLYVGTVGAYGRLVIVAHEDDYFTVYGGLGRVEVTAGQALGRGASLGNVAAGVEPSLFFEVRRGAESLDPHRWLGR